MQQGEVRSEVRLTTLGGGGPAPTNNWLAEILTGWTTPPPPPPGGGGVWAGPKKIEQPLGWMEVANSFWPDMLSVHTRCIFGLQNYLAVN